MGQEPNIEITDGEKPRPVLQPPPAGRWRPSLRPGMITAPDQVPAGGRFGMIGPDAGYALRILSGASLPDPDPDLKAVLGALMVARAAAAGRAPVQEDLEVALILCGYGYEAPDEVVERRRRWVEAVHHDLRPGETVLAEVDRDLLLEKPDQVRRAVLVSDRLGSAH